MEAAGTVENASSDPALKPSTFADLSVLCNISVSQFPHV